MKKPTKKRLEDELRWVWKWDDGSYSYGGSYQEKPLFEVDNNRGWKGKWVQVKFVEWGSDEKAD